MAINPNNAVEMPAGFIRDGQVDPSYLLKVNSDGSINTTAVGSSTIATDQVSIADTATLLVAARAGRSSVIFINPSAVTMYYGAVGVTTATGVPVLAGASAVIPTAAAVYAISASGTNTAAYVENY